LCFGLWTLQERKRETLARKFQAQRSKHKAQRPAFFTAQESLKVFSTPLLRIQTAFKFPFAKQGDRQAAG